jgi:hypothetical protein
MISIMGRSPHLQSHLRDDCGRLKFETVGRMEQTCHLHSIKAQTAQEWVTRCRGSRSRDFHPRSRCGSGVDVLNGPEHEDVLDECGKSLPELKAFVPHTKLQGLARPQDADIHREFARRREVGLRRQDFCIHNRGVGRSTKSFPPARTRLSFDVPVTLYRFSARG